MGLLKTAVYRVIGAYTVLTGTAMAVPIYDEDTSIAVIETQGSKVSFLSCKSFVTDEASYNVLLTKILLWMCSKPRFFWTSDNVGAQVREAAEAYFEEHKKPE